MIRELAESARQEPTLQDMDTPQAELWTAFCDGAEEIVWQLLVKNSDKRVDWGLKRQRRRIDQARLLTIYWWMLLYHLVLLKHRGVNGRSARNDLPVFETAARQFLDRHLRKLPSPVEAPRLWDDQWSRQFTLESAMGIYNAVYEMLGLFNDITKRINHVSHFTTATEQIFDELVKTLRD